jgi:NodT family efflux transporter outer membrane factor (OMF) lipoprotein
MLRSETQTTRTLARSDRVTILTSTNETSFRTFANRGGARSRVIMSAASRTLAFVVGLLLAGCITPPKVSPVERPVDTRTDLGLSPVPAPVQDAWWVAYQDPQLDRLLDAALADNPTLGEAMGRLHQAQAMVDATRADLWPHISYDVATIRQRISGKDAVPAPYQGVDAWRSLQGLNFSWELDFWGRQSSLVRQARSEAEARALDEAAARLAIVSAVVRTYIDLERSYELVDVARREEQQRQQILDITRHRLNAGLDTNVELKQAAGAVPQARVERLSDEAAVDRDVHLLAALSGHGADKYGEIQRPKLHTDTVLSLPKVLPIDILARRPDVRAARIRVSSARAGLDAARADFYPNIDLLAFAGTVAVGPFDNLFSPHAASYGAGPALHLPVFDAGRLKANYRANTADIDVAVTAYNQLVLTAVRETADQLSDIASLDASLAEQQQFLDDAEAAFRLATERYNAGVTTYLTVLTTETQVLDARRQRVDLEALRASARVTLLIDVGGDFRSDSPTMAEVVGY